jgi:lipoprotein-anchoring transpeptidase ErfK/SrfK
MTKFFVMLAVVAAAIWMIVTDANANVLIVVDKSKQTMYVETPEEYFEFKVSTGKKGKGTPNGVFKPYLMKKMHYSSRYNNSPMPYSIFYSGNYAIHGTTYVNRLGRPASNGCVRLHPEDAKFVYELVNMHGRENTFIYIKD